MCAHHYTSTWLASPFRASWCLLLLQQNRTDLAMVVVVMMMLMMMAHPWLGCLLLHSVADLTHVLVRSRYSSNTHYSQLGHPNTTLHRTRLSTSSCSDTHHCIAKQAKVQGQRVLHTHNGGGLSPHNHPHTHDGPRQLGTYTARIAHVQFIIIIVIMVE